MSIDKRQRQRFEIQCPVEILAEGTIYPGECTDFSTRGFSILVPQGFPETRTFKIAFSVTSRRDWVFAVKAAFRGEERENGRSRARIGVKIQTYPSNPGPFFEHMAQRAHELARTSPATRLQRSSSQGKTEITQRTEKLSHPSQGTASTGATTSEKATERIKPVDLNQTPAQRQQRRHEKRYPFTASAFVQIDEQFYEFETLDFSRRGVGAMAPMELPPEEQYALIVVDPDGGKFQLHVVERERKVVQDNQGLRLRIGMRILRAGEAYQGFFDKICAGTQPETVGRTTPKSKVEISNYQTAKVFQEDGAEAQPFGLLSKLKYSFIRTLGKGGFAEVHLVKDLALNRQVAMKILSPKFSQDQQLSIRFISEAQIAAQFQHPNIAAVFEVGEMTPDRYEIQLDFPEDILKRFRQRIVYFTMQYIDGHAISELLKREGKLEPRRALNLLAPVAKALEYAHEKGVVHRDIKPENIMVTLDGQVLVTDFGIAKILRAPTTDEDGKIMGEDEGKTMGFMGTPIYSAPEQAMNKGIDGRSDLYSLGVTAYEMLIGRPPFKGKRWVETIAMHLHTPPEPLINIDAQISQNLNDLVMKCLEKKQEDRFATATEFLQNLDRVLTYLSDGGPTIEALEEVDQQSHDLATSVFLQFAKTYKVVGTYPEAHEMTITAVATLAQRFQDFFTKHERLDLTVESMRFLFYGNPVWEEDQRENSFCFNMYRDGIRSLIFYRGLSVEELSVFIARLFRYVNDRKNFEEDSVTILFQSGFQCIDFEYVDSFYEDVDSVRRIDRLERNMTRENTWQLPHMLPKTSSAVTFLPFFRQLQAHLHKMNLDQLSQYFTTDSETAIRREAIKIFINLVRREEAGDVFDHQFKILEEVIFSCLQEKDLGNVVFIFNELTRWSESVSDEDPKHLAGRIIALKERLSQKEFLNDLVDYHFNVDRSSKEEIKQLAEFLIPNLAVKTLFARFLEEEEEWRRIFLAEVTVVACGAVLTPLVERCHKLSDENASLMLSGFSRSGAHMSNSIVKMWLKHPGPSTRLHLVRMFAASDRADKAETLLEFARDMGSQYEESRQFAWKYLAKKDPRNLRRIVNEFLEFEKFLQLSSRERTLLIQQIGEGHVDGGEDFLIGVLRDQGSFGQLRLTIEEIKLAADMLLKLGSPEALKAIEKMSKKLIGQREVINHCKQILGKG